MNFKKFCKRSDTAKPYAKASVHNSRIFFEEYFCIFQPHFNKILVRRFTVNSFKKSYKMKLREVCFACDIMEIDIITKMIINKKLCLYNTFVNIYFMIYSHR